MRLYLGKTVLQAAQERIAWLFDEFEMVIVNFSGGKDSTVVLQLALAEAEKRGRLPLPVLWIDQEGEWQSVVDYAEKIFSDPRVEPYWYQCPMVITNNASSTERFCECWEEGKEEEWIRPKSHLSIHENPTNEKRFQPLFEKLTNHIRDGRKCVSLAGVRAEESPNRALGLTYAATYKGETWGKKYPYSPDNFVMYPIYDWSHGDVWFSILDHDWMYCTLYDKMWQHGLPLPNMRVSNVHHETALRALQFMQTIEPETWNRVAARVSGAHSISALDRAGAKCPDKLPFMFDTWYEYMIHLRKHLVPENELDRFDKMWGVADQKYVHDWYKLQITKAFISVILASDWDYTKYHNCVARMNIGLYNKTMDIVFDRRERELTRMLWQQIMSDKHMPDDLKNTIQEKWDAQAV